jgi:hypothetical protein
VQSDSRFWTIGPDRPAAFATSRLDVTCVGALPSRSNPICTAFDGSRTRFFAIDAKTRRAEALAALNGRFLIHGDAAPGWVAGWWETTPVLLRPAKHEALFFSARPYQLAISDETIAAAWFDGGTSTVRIYSAPR